MRLATGVTTRSQTLFERAVKEAVQQADIVGEGVAIVTQFRPVGEVDGERRAESRDDDRHASHSGDAVDKALPHPVRVNQGGNWKSSTPSFPAAWSGRSAEANLPKVSALGSTPRSWRVSSR